MKSLKIPKGVIRSMWWSLLTWLYVIVDLVICHMDLSLSSTIAREIPKWGLCGCDRMVVGFTTTREIRAYHH